MNRAVGFIVAATLAGSGCGDNLGPLQMNHAQLLDRLSALPGVVSVTEAPTKAEHASYFILQFTQPVDHFDPAQSAGTLVQQVSLLHRSERAPVPMVVHTSGYADYYHDTEVELTQMFDANQVSIEHRYFGASRPVPTDWSKLTVEQMAEDEHAIIASLRTLYEGPFLTTGGSKGGATAAFHHRVYPDDSEGTVAYVAPISFGTPDPRYPSFFNSVGPDWCRHKVQELAIEMLGNRRGAFEGLAKDQGGYAYQRIAVGPAVESAIAGFEWGFWQYYGVDHCGTLPETTASDKDLFDFLDKVSPIHECSDQKLSDMQAYYYQTYNQLGYPDYSVPYLAPYMIYTDTDYEHELPTREPLYDSTAMHDVLDYFGQHGDRMLLIYGEWDPWIKGRLALGQSDDGGAYVEPEGTHSSSIRWLRGVDRDAAVAILQRWTGIAPNVGTLRRAGGASGAAGATGASREADLPAPRMRPVLVHAQSR